jgi:hypothetical protein
MFILEKFQLHRTSVAEIAGLRLGDGGRHRNQLSPGVHGLDAIEDAGGAIRAHDRASATTAESRMGVAADDGDGGDLRGIQWQQVVLVLQQDYTLACHLQGRFDALGVVFGDVLPLLLAIEEARSNDGAQDATDLFVDRGLGHGSIREGLLQVGGVHVFSGGHLQVEPTVSHVDAACRRPVGHEDALETHLLTQDVAVQGTVFRTADTIEFVECGHHAGRPALADRGLETRKVDFMQSALVHERIVEIARSLHVVAGKMLQGRQHAL